MSTEKTFTTIKKMLWATDFSKESSHCLSYIKTFSQAFKTENHALYVLPRLSDWVVETAVTSSDELSKQIEKTREKSLKKIAHYSQRNHLPFVSVVREGKPSEEIIKYAQEKEIDLIFAGRRGLSEIEEMIIGSTSSRLIRNSSVPVVIIPKKKNFAAIERILCPLDYNDFLVPQLHCALSLARNLGAKLYIVHIWNFSKYQLQVFKKEKLIEELDKEIVSVSKKNKYQVEEIIYDFGDPGKKIIDISKMYKIDLITTATHQRKGMEKFFLGSVSEKVLLYSKVPVMIVPPLCS